MSGGTWTTQNKVRPGTYINFKSKPEEKSIIGERGIATIPLVLSWGEPQVVISIESDVSTSDILTLLGYELSDSELLLVREALKKAKTLLLYRLNTGTKAAVTSGNLTITAKWGGVRGNDITIVIEQNVDDETKFDVVTFVSGVEVDSQTVANISGLVSNDWVDFSGTGALAETAGTPLVGGADGTVINQNYADYLSAVEVYNFNTMALPSTDTTLKATFVSFCKRLRDDEGKKIQVVLENYPTADYEGVISVKNGVILSDGTTLTAAQCTAWVAAATAAAKSNESLTYLAYDDAVDVSPRYTNSQVIAALQAGEFIFSPLGNEPLAIVEQDINTLTTFTVDKGKAFTKNRTLRVLDGINNDFLKIFSESFIGKISNNDNGRNLLKAECIKYLEKLGGIEAIRDFSSETDIMVSAGTDTDSVLIEVYIIPVDSIEKIYIAVTAG